MWPADIHNGEGSRAKSPVIQSTPIPHQTEGFILRELILGIKMLSVCWGGVRAEEGTLLQNYYVLVTVPQLCYTYTIHTQTRKVP